ncbi:PCI-domain-containing protein [Vararia minispora EC-137]|uniref:PCI-domain-containing protein n=1 Tax=Vararia minispora EC-137 TaxID=1314806 RepID=A0ACB8QBS3_9AGAM|nr:PCI-domain-containing protein [Vararia minispora EC-137]
MAEDKIQPYPNLSLPQDHFVLTQSNLAHLHADARRRLLDGVEADHMAPYYRLVAASGVVPLDEALIARMERENTDELARLDAKLKEAEEMEGETDIAEVLRAKAMPKRALDAHDVALEKTPGVGSRIDAALARARLGFFFGDNTLIASALATAEQLVEQGGDWDRRNRLKVYRGLHLLSIRQFKPATDLFIDALSTFTATELLPYNDFVSLTIMAGALTLERVELKKKIITASDVAQVLPELPTLADFVKHLYDCHYAQFFLALATLEQTHLLPSRLLHQHTRHYVREMRILAYAQLLQSYQSLTLDSLAAAFGVTVDFVDNELSRFIASGRLHASIDKVHGIVETTRPALKSAQTDAVLRKGDLLLNSVQRLSKVLY